MRNDRVTNPVSPFGIYSERGDGEAVFFFSPFGLLEIAKGRSEAEFG